MTKLYQFTSIFLCSVCFIGIAWLFHCIQMVGNWGDMWQLVMVGTVSHSVILVISAFGAIWCGHCIALLLYQRRYQRDIVSQRMVPPLALLSSLQAIGIGNDVIYYDDCVPFAACVGIWHPHIYLSRGIVELLPATSLQAVLAHEEGHRRRRDTFRYIVLVALRKTIPLPVVVQWVDVVTANIEIRADRFARQHTSTQALANALYCMLLLNPQPAHEVIAFSGTKNTLDMRLQALANPLTYSPPPMTISYVQSLVVVMTGIVITGSIGASFMIPAIYTCLLRPW